MSLPNHLIIFAKSPRLGQVKQRLGASIGQAAASGFYRHCLLTVIRRLLPDPRWRTYLALTPDRDLRLPIPSHGSLSRIAQGAGSLGDRMGRVMAGLPPGPAIIVGSDIPDIRESNIAKAFRILGDTDAVFGPAEDGGYWLVGLKRRPQTPEIFGAVRWSTPHALADTRANLSTRHSVVLIETLMDVDIQENYLDWRRRTFGQG